MAFTYQPETAAGRVRLLINDVDEATAVFNDKEIAAFLALNEDAVLLAAADAIDTIADNEALCSKVIRTQDLQTDGAKVADSLRKRAASLRERHDQALENEGYFEIIELDDDCHIELAGY